MATTAAANANPDGGAAGALQYPVTRQAATVNTYWGTKVPDPYSWLEQPDSAETAAWVEAQNKVSRAFLDECPDQAPLEQRLKEVYNYERFSCPWKKGKWVFFFRNSGLQNQSVLYKQRGLEGQEEVLLDPNALSEDGTASLRSYATDEKGELLAYGVSWSGSDWATIQVMDIEDGTLHKDKIEWVKFSSISWTHDSKGFFYARYPTPPEFRKKDGGADADADADADPDKKRGTEASSLKNHMVYYHRLGTPQSEDLLVCATPEAPEWMLSGHVSEDGNYLLVDISESCDTKNRFFYARLNDDKSYSAEVSQRMVKLIDRFEAQFSYVHNVGTKFYFRTNHAAGRYKVICIDVAGGAEAGLDASKWTDVVPEHESDVLDSAHAVAGDKLLVEFSRDVKAVLALYNLAGELLVPEFPLPGLGALSGLSARPSDTEFFFSFTSFLHPGVIFRVQLADLEAGQIPAPVVFRETKIEGFDPSQFETKQVFYESKDGTRIPMFIISKKGLELDGSNPTILYGYGGFNISLPPSFSVARVAWMQHFNGVYAVANLRGGGEYGESWYKQGVLLKKKNCFDDFISAAEYLVAQGYTRPDRLAINGGSNGGLLVNACVNQRPDLFGAVVGQVGVLDMLKFHTFTIGHAWTSDYGSAEQSKEMFEYLLSYSPVHTVPSDKPFPALLLCTSDHDDRVVPAHSYKYIATVHEKLRAHPQQTAPLLIRIETKAGHGAGLPLSKRIAEQADVFAFIAKVFGVKGQF